MGRPTFMWSTGFPNLMDVELQNFWHGIQSAGLHQGSGGGCGAGIDSGVAAACLGAMLPECLGCRQRSEDLETARLPMTVRACINKAATVPVTAG